jgi:peptidoglycan hydrolase-like protein with peptidoglycan-binding domain
VQERLIALGFDPGEADGIFGSKTVAAVWAYEKLIDGTEPSKVKGRVTPDMWLEMQDNIVIKPKRTKTTKTHMEIYLPSQVAILFVGKQARLVTHISSGTGDKWEEVVTIDPGEEGNETGTTAIQQLVSGTSTTPGGVYKFEKRYLKEIAEADGWREGRLGRMYKPVYFNFGLAVHGSKNVPKYPASHGCIRIPMHIAEYFRIS